MAVRALIIAIEEYPSAQGMAAKLPGTLQAGLDFQKWLMAKLKSEGRAIDAQLLFLSEPRQPGGNGATRSDVLEALDKLKTDGHGSTAELFVFFSGHGFAFAEKPGSRADVIITSDYKTNILSGDCCLNLNQIVGWLRDHLGPGKHYYFVDACRNKLNGSQIQPGSLLPWDQNAMAEATTYILQSTAEGAVAMVGAAFPTALLQGLGGRGKAKTWDPNVSTAMFVRYDSLRRFLREALQAKQPITNAVAGEFGESDAVFARIEPVTNIKCRFEIEGLSAGDAGRIVVSRARASAGPPIGFQDSPPILDLQPDSYSFSVQIDDSEVVPAQMTVELYEDATLHFQKAPKESVRRGAHGDLAVEFPAFDVKGLSKVKVKLPVDIRFSIRNIDTGIEHTSDRTTALNLPNGSYLATMRDKENRPLFDTEVELVSGADVVLNPSVPKVSIARRLPSRNGGLDFSESLSSTVADPDLNVWLALLGGGRILGSRGEYSKIGRFPLHDFHQETAGASPVYVLAGLEGSKSRLDVSVSRDSKTHWQKATQPKGMPGIREAYQSGSPGPRLVSFRLSGLPSYTVASLASRNRSTLITVTLDDDGNYCVSQYLLPLGHLIEQFPQEVDNPLQRFSFLDDVRFLAESCRAFRKRRNVFMEGTNGLKPGEFQSGEWLDPIGTALVGYEQLRRGKRPSVVEVVKHLQQFFPDFPDTNALAKLTGKTRPRPECPPLFFDGLRAYPDYADWLPLPASHLDFTSPWTAWRAAVS